MSSSAYMSVISSCSSEHCAFKLRAEFSKFLSSGEQKHIQNFVLWPWHILWTSHSVGNNPESGWNNSDLMEDFWGGTGQWSGNQCVRAQSRVEKDISHQKWWQTLVFQTSVAMIEGDVSWLEKFYYVLIIKKSITELLEESLQVPDANLPSAPGNTNKMLKSLLWVWIYAGFRGTMLREPCLRSRSGAN